MNGAEGSTNQQVLDAIKKTAAAFATKLRTKHWLSDEGQSELLRMIDDRSMPPQATSAKCNRLGFEVGTTPQSFMPGRPVGTKSNCSPLFSASRLTGNSLSPFDYTAASKAMLCPVGPAGGDEWVEVELTADTGACDTVIPRDLCVSIPIQPSLQSLRCMEYEVANGETIPNLGERRCLMWTEFATEARAINMQVADVHKALLSLSRCADIGFESKFGRVAGALIDEDTGGVIPLQRKGNLYVLKCWLRAAPFGRPVEE